MRADRLISMLMLLQTRGKMTAGELAQNLEVSVRTIYRDLEALSIAGVPVYAERGPGGGIALLDSYRTTLTGLHEDEVRALFMLSIPAPLTQLGVSQELKGALLKLSAALPATQRHNEERVRQRIYLDWTMWFQQEEPVPHLHTIQQAVWEDKWLNITYRLKFRGEIVERHIAPYGLVAKAGIWYVVAARDEHTHVYRVSRIVDADLGQDHFVRPPTFDLQTFWQQSCAEVEQNRPHYPVTARVSPDLVPTLLHSFGTTMHEQITQATPDAEGWLTLSLSFESLEQARARLLGFGGAIEVLSPLPLRMSIQDFAQQALNRYAQTGSR